PGATTAPLAISMLPPIWPARITGGPCWRELLGKSIGNTPFNENKKAVIFHSKPRLYAIIYPSNELVELSLFPRMSQI
ncbi:MAG: hypothetical protein K2K53_09020, partial [Oscillospiraceae bacterium]|nr:hypothetical protein [Oscillospiraceae bacterium]